MKVHTYAWGILWLLLAPLSWAQMRSGQVTDENNLPLPGASVIIEGSSRGTTSDFDGNYQIEAQAGEVLLFSYVGYADQRITVGAADRYDIQMNLDTALEEVVVLGYGTQNKSEITGSAKQIGSDKISQFPVTSADQALQGRVAGLSLTATSGVPGSVQNILIRGRSSITASTAPLFVIDGIPVNNGGIQQSTARSTFSPLANIDPENIESITVLKDPSSTAPYGARGTNGVIVITTKKGKEGKTEMNLTSSYGFQNDAIDGPQVLTGAEREELYYEALFNTYGESEGFTLSEAPTFYMNNINIFGNRLADWIERGRPETNWADIITVDDAPLQTVNFSARGGNSKTNFLASFGYMEQEATVIGSNFERFTATLNLKTALTDNLTLEMNNNVGYAEQDGVLEQSAYFASARATKYFAPPIWSPYNADGSLNIDRQVGSNYNPLYLAQEDIDLSQALRLTNNTQLVWQTPLPNLTAKAVFGVDMQRILLKLYANRNHGGSVDEGGTASVDSFVRTAYTYQNSLNYFRSFNDHNFDFTVLQEFQLNRSFDLSADGESFAADGLPNLSSAGTPTDVSSTFLDWSNAAYLGLVNYNYAGKYLFNASYRREGNSRFPTDHRWGNFWSVGLGWNMHLEPFMNGIEFINTLKVRASVGTTGNSGIGLNTYQSSLGFSSNYAGSAATFPSSFGNPILQWELADSYEIGLDFSLLNNRLEGSFNYYFRQTKDMLQDVPLSRTTGFSSQNQNVGVMENSGIEIEFFGRIIDAADFGLSIGGNIGTNNNEVIELALDGNGDEINITTGTRKVETGHTVYEWFMVSYAGVNPDNGNAQYYTDASRTTVTEDFNSAERVYQGAGATPTLLAGLTLNLDYKGFFLSAQANYSGGHKIWEDWSRYTNGSDRFSVDLFNGLDKLLDRWQQPGDITDVPKMTYTLEPWRTHNRFLHDGDFIRLRELTLGYDFDSALAETIGMDQIRVFVRGINLYTWVRDDDLVYDPETESDGFLGLTNPPTRNIILGFNFKF
ncbi:MAG: SusC/RagA family TonB-linked outer membrane protein [Flavobacteriaceae bacterium]